MAVKSFVGYERDRDMSQPAVSELDPPHLLPFMMSMRGGVHEVTVGTVTIPGGHRIVYKAS